MMRLIAHADTHKEAPMLVGSTGLGKTTAVSVVADWWTCGVFMALKRS
jgi:MoxR-like ATPase